MNSISPGRGRCWVGADLEDGGADGSRFAVFWAFWRTEYVSGLPMAEVIIRGGLLLTSTSYLLIADTRLSHNLALRKTTVGW